MLVRGEDHAGERRCRGRERGRDRESARDREMEIWRCHVLRGQQSCRIFAGRVPYPGFTSAPSHWGLPNCSCNTRWLVSWKVLTHHGSPHFRNGFSSCHATCTTPCPLSFQPPANTLQPKTVIHQHPQHLHNPNHGSRGSSAAVGRTIFRHRTWIGSRRQLRYASSVHRWQNPAVCFPLRCASEVVTRCLFRHFCPRFSRSLNARQQVTTSVP